VECDQQQHVLASFPAHVLAMEHNSSWQQGQPAYIQWIEAADNLLPWGRLLIYQHFFTLHIT